MFTISDSILILATFLGSTFAVQVQKFIEMKKEVKNRKLWIFHTLMATRANRIADRHVEALNMIDLEYHHFMKGKGKQVKEAWHEYHNILNDRNVPRDQWVQKSEDLFINLLHKMSIFLGFNYNKVDIQRSCYSPVAHGERDTAQAIILKGLGDIFAGKASFPVSYFASSNEFIKKTAKTLKGISAKKSQHKKAPSSKSRKKV